MTHARLLRPRRAVILFVFMAFTWLAEAGPFYVVVGSFSEQGNARRFAQAAAARFSGADFRFDPGRKLYHVHVLETTRFGDADNFRDVLRKQNGFAGAWVYTDLEALTTADHLRGSGEEHYARLELYTGGSVLLGAGNAGYLSVSKSNASGDDDNAAGYRQSFSFLAGTLSGISLEGAVSLLDNKGQVLYRFRTSEAVGLVWKEAGQKLTLMCEVAGYAPETRVLDAGDVSGLGDVRQNKDGIWEVRLPMVRFRVDEVNLLFRDLFHDDAAVFRSHARERLGALVAVLKGNPRIRLVINAHCNAGTRRRIRLPGPDYFDLAGAGTRAGGDKQLTAGRAATLRAWLADHGIDPDRITEMGWGSLDPLVKEGTRMSLNERVEVELVFE